MPYLYNVGSARLLSGTRFPVACSAENFVRAIVERKFGLLIWNYTDPIKNRRPFLVPSNEIII